MKLLLIYPPPLPQSNDEQEQKRYRRAMHRWTVNVSAAIAIIVALISISLSPFGFALRADLTEVRTVQLRDSTRLAISLSNGVASELRFLQYKRCKETNYYERERIWREITRKQDEYKDYRAEFYLIPSCVEL